MKAFYEDLNVNEIRKTLEDAPLSLAIESRLERISRRFLGVRYDESTLIGSKSSPEVFTASLDAFDCVTYVECVLALALASNPDEFLVNLRRLRYSEGLIDWKYRNHYMTSWIRNNVRQGFVRNQTRRDDSIIRSRCLDFISGLSHRTIDVRAVPKNIFLRRTTDVKDGDLVFFGSTKRNLDIFHCGLVFNVSNQLVMRHAAKSQKCVVEQSLEGFLRANRMTGVILVRPINTSVKSE